MNGEDKFVVMFGGLHIEIAALRKLGDWLQGNGWVDALVQAEITKAGTANTFLRAAHGACTRPTVVPSGWIADSSAVEAVTKAH